MDWSAARVAFDLVQFIMIGAVGVYSHIIARQRVTEDELDQHKSQVSDELSEIAQRLTRVEESHRHAPDHEDLGGVYEKMNEVHGQLREMVGELRGIQSRVNLISQHLLERR